MHFARVDGDQLSGATALVRSPIPNTPFGVIDNTHRPGRMTMAGILVTEPHGTKTLEIRDCRHRPGMCRRAFHIEALTLQYSVLDLAGY